MFAVIGMSVLGERAIEFLHVETSRKSKVVYKTAIVYAYL